MTKIAFIAMIVAMLVTLTGCDPVVDQCAVDHPNDAQAYRICVDICNKFTDTQDYVRCKKNSSSNDAGPIIFVG